MLTADLVRATTRKGVLHPRWIEPDDARLQAGVAELIAAYQAHVGEQAGVLDDAVTELTVAESDPILWKGFVKLLSDRTSCETRAEVPPATIRAAVFRAAGARWPIVADVDGATPDGATMALPGLRAEARRGAVLAEVARELGISVAAIETGLYGDRPAEQWVTAFAAPTPEALLREYNLALAQAALLRAREVVVELDGIEAQRARAVFRELKFRRLLARSERTAKGWRLVLDGPLSLFRQTSRYGVQLALFLPALVRCPSWRLAAEVTLGGRGGASAMQRTARLELSDASPLEVERGRHDAGVWTSPEEEHFVRGFEALGSAWRLERAAEVVDLDGQDVLLPDYVLRHPDGREALLELVWAWRKTAFAKRRELLLGHGPGNLVIAWAEKGGLDAAEGSSKEAAALSALGERATGIELVRFKGVVPPKRIVEAAERVARAPRRGAAAKVSAKPSAELLGPRSAALRSELTPPSARATRKRKAQPRGTP